MKTQNFRVLIYAFILSCRMRLTDRRIMTVNFSKTESGFTLVGFSLYNNKLFTISKNVKWIK